MKALLDIDGVLANFLEGACQVHSRPNPYDFPENFGQYHIEKIWEMTPEEFIYPMDYEFWKNLKPYDHADAFCDYIINTFGFDNVCLLTSPLSTYGCLEGKRDWIKEHFPTMKWLIGSAKYFCAHPNSVLIDDSIVNCEKFVNQGGRAFLVPGYWNHKYDQDPLKALMGFVQNLKSTGVLI